MPILFERITELVLAGLFVIVLATGVEIGLAFARRRRHQRYFREIDALRCDYGPLVAAILSRRFDYNRGVAILATMGGPNRDRVLEQLCMESRPTAEGVPVLRNLCEDLGLVSAWRRKLAHKRNGSFVDPRSLSRNGSSPRRLPLSFLERAKAAEKLGFIRHRSSWPLLVEALEDFHPDVQAAALGALRAIQEPRSFSRLIETLHAAILGPQCGLSLRSVKAALVDFPLEHASGLLSSLEHSHPRVRFAATDIIREMVEREAAARSPSALELELLTSEVAEVFLTRLWRDPNPDVRARVAPVIAKLQDARAAATLVRLLGDVKWFVRLRAARALSKPEFLLAAPQLAERLTDAHWMVREAAARALLAFGPPGVNQLIDHFLEVRDRYSREQVADIMQRTGFMPILLAQYATGTDHRRGRVIRELARMGKTSCIVAFLRNGSDQNIRRLFLRDFGQSLDPEIQAWVQQMALLNPLRDLRGPSRASAGEAAASGGF